MTYCCATGCNHRSSNKGVAQIKREQRKKITFHRLPKNQEKRKKWLEAINRPDLSDSPIHVLCSEHFADECFDRTSLATVRLREFAFPTIFNHILKTKSPKYISSPAFSVVMLEGSNKTQGAKYLAEFSKCITDNDILPDPLDLQKEEQRNKIEIVTETIEAVTDIIEESDINENCLYEILQEDNYLDVPTEDELPEYDLNNICRVCLENNDKLLSIDTQFFGLDKLYDMILMCVDITLPAEVQFCKKICMSCAKNLKFVYEFFKQLEKSRLVLEEYCKNRDVQSESVLKDHDYLEPGSDEVILEVLDHNEGITEMIGQNEGLTEMINLNDFEIIKDEMIEIVAEKDIPIMDSSSAVSIEILTNKISESVGKQKILDTSNKCQICNKKFKSTQKLASHTCDPKKFTFACSKCNKNMISIFGLTNHLCVPEKVEIATIEVEEQKDTNTATNQVSRCGRCDIVFESIEELRKHRNISHNGAKIVTCSICNKNMTGKNYTTHKKWHVNQRRKVLCELCGKSFTTISQLNQHNRHFHLKLRPFACDLCEKTFPNKPKLIEHRRIHFDERPFICELCGLSFRQMNCLSRHINMKRCVNGNRPKRNTILKHQCGICNLNIVGRKNLLKHMREIHPLELGISTERIFKCDQCEDSFRTVTALKNHSIVHAETRYHCSKCSCVFLNPEKLEAHEVRHSDTAVKYICDICTKPFLSKQSLSLHMVVHTGERKYLCSFCPKSFKQNSHLALHQRIHTGFKPYRCPYCNKAFALNGNLTVHIRTHTGERPYKCEYCDQAFYDSSSAKKHITVKHMNDLM